MTLRKYKALIYCNRKGLVYLNCTKWDLLNRS